MGCGRVGASLAEAMERRGHTVSVIDRDPTAFKRLSPEFAGTTTVGMGFDREVLTRAGIEKADAFAAVTPPQGRLALLDPFLASEVAYAALDRSRVKGTSRSRILTDLVSLVRFAMQQDNELVPYPERVAANFAAWLAASANAGRQFTPEQQHWLQMIRDHIAANLGINIDDFEYAPFNTEGGLGRVHQLFGERLPQVIEELNRELVA